METASLLSSLNDECRSDNYVEPHYQEWYRLAVDTLVEHGAEAYQEFLTKERAADFLAEEEVSYILQHVQRLAPSPACSPDGSGDDASSLGTYWPEESDVEAPDLDLGWPYVMPGLLGGTQVELLFHPPRAQLLTIKETIRKMVKEARKVVALVMDIFTDVDIFKEVVEASARGVSVYILLDESNFCHFLKMTEKQGCQVQRLRNIRVRTVKGQDYISKTGAKFHGKLEQKFLLVDCQKVLYGSYSYMWSFEKAHLSMAQLISGQLVESFDEEFRTLYARSCVPGALAPEGAARARPGRARWENGLGPRSVSSLASLSSRRNLLWRPAGTPRADAGFAPQPRGLQAPLEPDKYSYGGRNHGYRPHFLPPTNGPSPAARAFQPGALAEGWKRHSYAGEPSETPPFLLPGRAALHALPAPPAWRRPADALSVASSARGHGDAPSASLAERLAPRKSGLLGERNAPVRRSFHGTDSHVRSLQQRMPTLERTTRTFLRTWRLESYLNDRADAAPDAGGSLAGERPDGPDGALYARSRLRSSFVFKPTLPEQKEVNSCTTSSSNSTIVGSQGSDTSRPAPDSPAAAAPPPPEDAPAPAPPASPEPAIHGANGHAEPDRRAPPRTAQDEQRLKRRSFPSFELARAGLDPAKPSLYGTLTRARARPPAPPAAPPPPLHGSRSLHSVAPGPERADAAAPAPRSPAPGRAAKSASMAALLDAPGEEPGRELAPRKEGKASPSFLKKGSQKLRSLLSLTPDRKDGLSRARAPAFYRLCSSSDTLLSEADDGPAPRKSEPKADAAPPPRPAGGSVQRSREDVRAGPASPRPGERPPLERPGDASAPRFNTEQIQYRDPREAPAASPGLLRSRSAAGQRVYSRFEPFCKLEGALPPPGSPARPRAARPEARASALGYGGSGASPALGYGGAAYRPFPPGGENKLRGFMQRFGSLINKSK